MSVATDRLSPAQLIAFRERIKTIRQPIHDKYPYPKGWNDAIDHVEKTLKEILGEGSDGQARE